MGCSNITLLRTLFASPTSFITDAVTAAVDLGLDGFNLDFEPCVGCPSLLFPWLLLLHCGCAFALFLSPIIFSLWLAVH
jgi:hypothetical protein